MGVMANIPQPSRNYKVEVSTGEAEQKAVRHTTGIMELLHLLWNASLWTLCHLREKRTHLWFQPVFKLHAAEHKS